MKLMGLGPRINHVVLCQLKAVTSRVRLYSGHMSLWWGRIDPVLRLGVNRIFEKMETASGFITPVILCGGSNFGGASNDKAEKPRPF